MRDVKTPLQPPRPLSSLVRLRGEAIDAHQMLLLYAMLGPKRTVRRIASIMRRAASTTIQRAKVYEWERRVKETPEPDIEAWRIYAAEHLHRRGGRRPLFAILEQAVPLIGVLARIDIAALPPDPEDGPETVEVDNLAPGGPVVAAGAESLPIPGCPKGKRDEVDTPEMRPAGERVAAAIAQPAADPEARAKDSPEHAVELIDTALEYVMAKLRANEVKVRMSDLSTLLRTRELLRGGATERVQHTGLPGADLPETIRLRNISDQRDRLRVMREDIAELAAILDAVAASEEQAPINEGRVVETTAAPGGPPVEPAPATEITETTEPPPGAP